MPAQSDAELLRLLLIGMREAFQRGDNAMEWARRTLNEGGADTQNRTLATLVAYDLQSGSYVANARQYPEDWCTHRIRWSPMVGGSARRSPSA